MASSKSVRMLVEKLFVDRDEKELTARFSFKGEAHVVHLRANDSEVSVSALNQRVADIIGEAESCREGRMLLISDTARQWNRGAARPSTSTFASELWYERVL